MKMRPLEPIARQAYELWRNNVSGEELIDIGRHGTWNELTQERSKYGWV